MYSRKKLIKISLVIVVFAVIIGYIMWPGTFGEVPPPPPEGKEPFTALVIGVANGDTLTILNKNNQQVPIRLFGVEAPKRRQPYGILARDTVREWIYMKNVLITPVDKDEYGRTSVLITMEKGNFVQDKLVREGLAWVREDMCQAIICIEWKRDMEFAKEARKGLWADENPMPPWLFQKHVIEQQPW